MKKRLEREKMTPGDPIELLVLDHSSDDTVEGWRTQEEVMESKPEFLAVRGYWVGEDKHTVKVAFAKCGGSYSTIFNVVKSAIVKQTK